MALGTTNAYNANESAELAAHVADTQNPHAVTAAQTGAVPTTREVNGKALSGDITLTAADVGAASASHTHQASDISGLPGPSLTLVQAYKTAGSHVWTCPASGDYIALIIGGGGGGVSGGSSVVYAGGASGYWRIKRATYAKDAQVTLEVGAGGAAANSSLGNTGGSSTFDGESVYGGSGGNRISTSAVPIPRPGGQPSIALHKLYTPFGGVTVGSASENGGIEWGTPLPACFVDENGFPATHLCAGGAGTEVPVILVNGNTMAESNTATAPTDPGAGGASGTDYASDGAPGAVFIYRAS